MSKPEWKPRGPIGVLIAAFRSEPLLLILLAEFAGTIAIIILGFILESFRP